MWGLVRRLLGFSSGSSKTLSELEADAKKQRADLEAGDAQFQAEMRKLNSQFWQNMHTATNVQTWQSIPYAGGTQMTHAQMFGLASMEEPGSLCPPSPGMRKLLRRLEAVERKFSQNWSGYWQAQSQPWQTGTYQTNPPSSGFSYATFSDYP